ncbi:HAMP domain-containing methyl-accepting chemotaxis protein [Selenomonas ruminis]|uniref:Methyl-accepting chemotaxis protein n=1 Tax=Selenomonas ruminis TaxID=2593411 RepID=A0A5D6WCS3_9FIRM|nr:methyl-accepting chemotaxis protein [Selenomonas sp. mPRGC5]TYZ24628.1 methyl-accepting chemotaxis protein [Selenomonas sp. mPRGC5]
MNWFNNLRVSGKIICMIVMTGLALALVGWNATSYLRSIQGDMDRMYNRNMQAVRLLGDCSVTVRCMQARILENVSLTDKKQLEKNKKDIQNYMNKYEESWNEYKALGSTVEGAEVVEQHWQGFKNYTNEMLDLSLAGKQEEARALYGTKAIKEIINWDNNMVPLRKAVNAEAEEINQQNQAEVVHAILSMSVITLIAMVVMCLFGWTLSRAIRTPLEQMMVACRRLRDGDFRNAERQINRMDEFGDMADVVDSMRQQLNKLMDHTSQSAEHIASASEQLTASSQQSAKASQSAAESVSQASGAVSSQQGGINDCSSAIGKVADSVGELQSEASRVAEHAKAASDQAIAGSTAIQQSVEQIRSVEATVGTSASIVDKLGARSQEIGQIVETISGIAEQTNLLALNAAIEAARAGEQGRGFSVVADEVRKLAEQSQEAAQQISTLIVGIQKDTASAVDSMKSGSEAVASGAQSVENLRETFDNIRSYVDEVSEQVNRMAVAIKNVASDANVISNHIQEIDAQGATVAGEMQNVSAISEEQSASAAEIASASDSLAELAQNLQNSLKKFKF